MERERGTKIIAVIALCLAVLGLGIGYAAFSTTLNISGTAQVAASSWDVHFENLGVAVKVGDANEVIAPALDTTSVSGFEVSLMAPGDSISYTFDIVNDGTFDAIVSGAFVLPTPTCTGTGATAEADATLVCNNLNYTFTYVDGGTAVAASDTLTTGQTRAVKLMLELDSGMTEAPVANVNITNLGFSIVYGQN